MGKIASSPRKSKRNQKRSKTPQTVYRVKNWAAYDEALKQRGSLTVWFSKDAIKKWKYDGPPQRGAQFQYSDLAIETALTLGSVYDLPLRQTEGFVQSLMDLMRLSLSAPDHSTLSRRNPSVEVRIPTRLPAGEAGLPVARCAAPACASHACLRAARKQADRQAGALLFRPFSWAGNERQLAASPPPPFSPFPLRKGGRGDRSLYRNTSTGFARSEWTT